MKKLLLNVVMCVLAMAGSTQGAWAYSIPEGYEVKDVLLGTLENGDVSAETFEADDAALANWTNSSKFSIVEEVPTDVWNSLSLNMSGRTMRLGSKTTHDLSFATTKTSGKVIFSTDIYVGTHAKKIQFIDANDNIIAYILYPDKSPNNGRVYDQPYLFAGDSYTEGATFSGSYVMHDTYLGTRNREYQITEFVIDLDNNTITYSGNLMDRRTTNKWCADNATITFSTDIAGIKGIRIDATACGNANYYAYFDNMLLYNVDKKAGTYSYTVNAVCGGEKLQEIESGVTDGENDKTVYYPYAINANGSWYITTSNVLGTNITESGEIKVPYEKSPYIVAFTEGEAAVANTTYVLSYSKGLTGHVESQNKTNRGIAMGTLAPGKYRFVANVIENAGRGVTLRDQSSDNALTNIIAATNNASTGVQTIEFTLENATTIVLCGKNAVGDVKANQSADFDYAYIEKTAETISLPYTYTTFSSTAALDFTGNTDVEAYMAQVNGEGTAVTLRKVTQVPAGEGVVLKKISDAETTTVKVLADAAALAGNQMVGVTEDNTVHANELITAGNAYVLVEEQFCKVVTGATGYIPAGKAYLSVPVRNAAKALRLDFNGTPTEAVSVAEKAEKAQDAIYNVQGIRVQKPTVPGLYIVNGKTYRF